jgi:hypothetical protein
MLAPILLDQTFLTPHWRTVLWWKQREQCNRCRRMIESPIKGRAPGVHQGSDCGGGMVCDRVTGKFDRSCITARDEGKPCGPDALLFEEL